MPPVTISAVTCIFLPVNVPRSKTEGFYAVACVGRVPTESCLYAACRMLMAALVSRSSSHPHVQLCQRSLRAFLTTVPHPEHIWLVYLGSICTSVLPAHAAL